MKKWKTYWNEEIETMNRTKLEQLQLERLKKILAFSYENSTYYRRSFDAAMVKPDDLKSLRDLEKFPFIDKQTERQTQGVGTFLGELCAVEEEDVVFISTSTGSTGVPTISPFTKEDFDTYQDIQSRWFWQVGMRPSDRYVHGLNFSLYVGGPDVIGAQNIGALCVWGGTLPSERLLYILKNYQPTVLWTSPSYAWQLGEKAKNAGINPKTDLSIRKIIVAGEPGGSIGATRTAIEELWGAELYDFYGLSDIFGACAAMCEAKDGLHICEDQILVETIDLKTGQVLPAGSVGELVYTSLCKKARPMIRFRSGDIGYIDNTPCVCGRTHGRIHINGRKDDMFIVSAVNVFPSDIEAVIHEIKEITGEYLIRIFEQNYTCKYGVEVEINNQSTSTKEEIATKISIALKARIGVKPSEVLVRNEGELPTRSEHKSRRILDERKLDYTI